MFAQSCRFPVLFFLVGVLPGCSSPSPPPSKLVVTLDGQPLANAVVVLQSEGAGDPAAMGNTNSAGAVLLQRISSRKAIPSGTYRVIVMSMDYEAARRGQPGHRLVPRVYSDVSTTPLSIEIPIDGEQTLQLVSE